MNDPNEILSLFVEYELAEANDTMVSAEDHHILQHIELQKFRFLNDHSEAISC